jgi:integrase
MKHIDDYREPERVNAMLNAANACSLRDYLMLRVLWRSGIRVSELVTIRPEDIERDNGVVNILKAKGGKQRRIMLDSETILMLSRYVSETELGGMKTAYFPSRHGTCGIWSRNTVEWSALMHIPPRCGTALPFTL